MARSREDPIHDRNPFLHHRADLPAIDLLCHRRPSRMTDQAAMCTMGTPPAEKLYRISRGVRSAPAGPARVITHRNSSCSRPTSIIGRHSWRALS
jgi:hypothetical protein